MLVSSAVWNSAAEFFKVGNEATRNDFVAGAQLINGTELEDGTSALEVIKHAVSIKMPDQITNYALVDKLFPPLQEAALETAAICQLRSKAALLPRGAGF